MLETKQKQTNFGCSLALIDETFFVHIMKRIPLMMVIAFIFFPMTIFTSNKFQKLPTPILHKIFLMLTFEEILNLREINTHHGKKIKMNNVKGFDMYEKLWIHIKQIYIITPENLITNVLRYNTDENTLKFLEPTLHFEMKENTLNHMQKILKNNLIAMCNVNVIDTYMRDGQEFKMNQVSVTTNETKLIGIVSAGGRFPYYISPQTYDYNFMMK